MAAALAPAFEATVIEGDEFYAGDIALRGDSPEARIDACIDWIRQRQVLPALRAGQPTEWCAFDWDAFDGRLLCPPAKLSPAKHVTLEGVYAGRNWPICLTYASWPKSPPDTRKARLLARKGTMGYWERQWHEADEHHFQVVMPPRTLRSDLLRVDLIALPASCSHLP